MDEEDLAANPFSQLFPNLEVAVQYRQLRGNATLQSSSGTYMIAHKMLQIPRKNNSLHYFDIFV
jgi:hypothetical protein